MVAEQPQANIRAVRQTLQLPTGRFPQPTLILLCGLPGTGKSHLARCLSQRLPLVVIAADDVRRFLFPEPCYTPEEHYTVHSTCQGVVADLLKTGHSAILDATNLRRRHREHYYGIAEHSGASLLIIQTTALPEVVRQRLQARQEGAHPPDESDAGWDVYQAYSEKTEPIRRPHRVVDTSGEIEDIVEEIASQMEGTPTPLPSNLRARLVLNPAASKSYRLTELDETFGFLVRHGWELGLRETHGPNEAMLLARQAAEEGLDLVIAIGGDGTVNEVVNGLAGTPTALATLPMGAGNVWAREQNLPLEPDTAARVLVQGQFRSVDLGLAGSRYFLMMASVGFDAAVVRAMAGEGRQPFWPLSYIFKGINIAVNFAGEETVITIDDREIGGETVMVVIGNTRLYGGLAQITHQASIDDGLLDVCIFRGKGGFSQISMYTLMALLQRQDRVKGVDYYQGREVTISSETPLFVQTDGEPIGTTPMTFRVVPRALRVLVPRKLPEGLFSVP
jgi:YegS/Rv2252/BmrU family lipid kinase